MCLEVGLFSRATLKPLDKVFDFDDEKRVILEYIRGGEWFTVSGIRRVGKTTLVRSVVNHLGFRSIYINLWEIDEDRPFSDFVLRFSRELLSLKDSSWRRRLRSIEEISVLGFRVRIRREEVEFYLDELIGDILSRDRLVVILDEVYTLGGELRTLARLLAVLHDKYAPKLTVILLGSIASIRDLFETKTEETEPLYGRITREFVLRPLALHQAKRFLRAGFEECGVDVDDEIIDMAVDELGTITGWLVEFGREYVLEARALSKVDPINIIRRVQRRSRQIVYGEIARALRGKRRPDIYLRILKLIANNPNITLAELSEALNRKKPTILQYTNYLAFRNIIKAEEGHYNIADPLYRRAILHRNFEVEVKKRL